MFTPRVRVLATFKVQCGAQFQNSVVSLTRTVICLRGKTQQRYPVRCFLKVHSNEDYTGVCISTQLGFCYAGLFPWWNVPRRTALSELVIASYRYRWGSILVSHWSYLMVLCHPTQSFLHNHSELVGIYTRLCLLLFTDPQFSLSDTHLLYAHKSTIHYSAVHNAKSACQWAILPDIEVTPVVSCHRHHNMSQPQLQRCSGSGWHATGLVRSTALPKL